MDSAIVGSDIVHNMKLLAEDLAGGILKKINLKQNSCGLLFCESDLDHSALNRFLQDLLPFPVVGCSTVSTLSNRRDLQDMTATLTVLTADNCDFKIGVSEQVTYENVSHQIRQTWNSMDITQTPGLLIAFPPYNPDIMIDRYAADLSELSGCVPLIGGYPTHLEMDDVSHTFENGTSWDDRLVLLQISGNIQPVFAMSNVLADSVRHRKKITESKDNVIYTVDGMSFSHYLRQSGLKLDELKNDRGEILFISFPLLIEEAEDGEAGQSYVRALNRVDDITGAGYAVASIPPNAYISICSLKRNDILDSAEQAVRLLNERMAKNSSGYQYSTVICISCYSRHVMLTPFSNAENDIISDHIHSSVTVTGFYAFGELSPTAVSGLRAHNRAHNESIVFCAF